MERQISIRLPDGLRKEIDKRARRRKRRRSDVIREALLAFTRMPDGTFDAPGFGRARDWIGRVEGLPPDRTTHAEKTMKGFGGGRG